MKIVLAITTALALSGCSRTYSVPLAADEKMNEAVAVRDTRAALEAAGVDVSHMEPVPFGDTPAVFAQNSFDPNNGYVLWRRIGERRRFSYSVSVEVVGQEVLCKVGETE